MGKVQEYFVPFLIAVVFGSVFLEMFPSINATLRSLMPTGLIPLVGAEITLFPYILCIIAAFVFILIIRSKLNS
jgi:ABC-type thiamin/hydroxymethylpyrimidine transport system permease subunit